MLRIKKEERKEKKITLLTLTLSRLNIHIGYVIYRLCTHIFRLCTPMKTFSVNFYMLCYLVGLRLIKNSHAKDDDVEPFLYYILKNLIFE